MIANLRDIEEPPIWRKPSERRPAPHPKAVKVEGEDELNEMIKKQDKRGFVSPFTSEKWKALYDEFHSHKESGELHPEGLKAGGKV